MTDDVSQRIAQLESQLANLKAYVGGKDESTASAPASTASNADEVVLNAMGKSLTEALSSLAPLKALLDDDTINDVLINGPDNVYIERSGKLIKTDVTFPSDSKVFELGTAIGKQIGRHLNPSRPLLDARLPDGSRVNIIAPPLAVDGTSISIRKFAKFSITLDQMVERKNVSPQLGELLKVIGAARINVIISGGTGSGKTTMLNAVSQFISDEERVVTIEDAAELRLQQPHVVRLETRPVRASHAEEEVTIRDLMKNALRMRPDRILVGEVRGAEAFDMMQAMNTGHEGSLTTIHANHPRDALARLENMIAMANLNLTPAAIRAQIASAIHLIVQVSRMRDGKRRVTYISELVGMENDIITMQDLFTYQNKGEGSDGMLIGDFKWSGIVPRFFRRAMYYGQGERLSEALGVKLPKV